MPARPALQCLNCEAKLDSGQAYCGRCGQKVSSARITLNDIGHDVARAFVDVDRSALSLLRMLIVCPGDLARDYVIGRRRRYFGPFSLLVVVIGLAALVVGHSGFRSFTAINPYAVANLLQRHVNLVILLQVPILAAFCGAMFRDAGLNFAETMVLGAYASSMHALLFLVLVIPCWYLLRPGATAGLYLYSAYFGVWLMYFGFAASQFYRGNRAASWVKGLLAAAFTQATTQVIVSLVSQ